MSKKIEVSQVAQSAPKGEIQFATVTIPAGHGWITPKGKSTLENFTTFRTMWDAKLTPTNGTEGMWLKKSLIKSIKLQADGSYIVTAPESVFAAYNYKRVENTSKAS